MSSETETAASVAAAREWTQPGFALVSDISGTPLVHEFTATKWAAANILDTLNADIPEHFRRNLAVVPAEISFTWPPQKL